MKAVILIGFRSEDPQRVRNWRYAISRWREVGWPIFVGDNEGEFERTKSRNQAAREAGDWEVAVLTDADTFLEHPVQAVLAAETALETGSYVVAHDVFWYLSEEGTQKLVAGARLDRSLTYHSIGRLSELPFAIRRDLWDTLGGYDERFRGWGAEGNAFLHAAVTFGGFERISGGVYHLFHELPDRTLNPHLTANYELDARYRSAFTYPDAMKEVIAR